MKNLFDPQKTTMRLVGFVTDFILLNLLFAVLCLPVFTIGAAAAAMNEVMHFYYETDRLGRLERFFQSFRGNFRAGTAGLLLFALTGMVLLGNALFLLSTRFAMQGLAFAVLFAAAAVWLAAAGWFFQILAANPAITFRRAIVRAWKLLFAFLPETFACLVLSLLPLSVLFMPARWLHGYVVAMALAGFSVQFYLQACILACRVWRRAGPGD